MTGHAVAGVLVLLLFTALAVVAAQLDLVVWAILVLIVAGLACGMLLPLNDSWELPISWGLPIAVVLGLYGAILVATIETPLFGSISRVGQSASDTATVLRTDPGWRVAVEFLSDRTVRPRRRSVNPRTVIAPVVPPGWTVADPVPAWAILLAPTWPPTPAEWTRPGLELLLVGPSGMTECEARVRLATAQHELIATEVPRCFRWTTDASADLNTRRLVPLLAWLGASALWIAAVLYARRRGAPAEGRT